ncbi:MAG: hypothetical protein MN733_21740, partial [Nitrososphaera sp.]|nr:hypothetical protein [Nitrososphaera sp.]
DRPLSRSHGAHPSPWVMRSPTASKWDFGNCEPGYAGDSGLKGVLLPVLCPSLGQSFWCTDAR